MKNELDKVYEAYMNDESTQKDRINWICSQAIGENILDIGCSQGIISMLLGRENKKVLGLDIEKEAILFAQEKLKLESEEVQKNVNFQVADFMEYDFVNKKYNTIILTEVLEHIVDTKKIINKIALCLDMNGILIVSVPFGINDHWDHKRTYYFGNLYQDLRESFEVVTVEYIHKWIAVICNPKNQGKEINIDIDLLLKEEKEFYRIERVLIDEKEKYKNYIELQKQQKINLIEKNDKLREQISNLQIKLTDIRDKNIKLKDRDSELKEKLTNIQDKNNKFKERDAKLKIKLNERQEKINQLAEQNKELIFKLNMQKQDKE